MATVNSAAAIATPVAINQYSATSCPSLLERPSFSIGYSSNCRVFSAMPRQNVVFDIYEFLFVGLPITAIRYIKLLRFLIVHIVKWPVLLKAAVVFLSN